MAQKIHPATLKKATENSLTIKVTDDGIFEVYGKGRKPLATDRDAKVALTNAIEAQKSEDGETSGIMKKKYLQRYELNNRSCGDKLSDVFREATTKTVPGGKGKKDKDIIDIKALHKIAKENGLDVKKWAKLNPGLQRMTIGNIIRSMARRGEKPTINGKVQKAA